VPDQYIKAIVRKTKAVVRNHVVERKKETKEIKEALCEGE
jgi:hypothetical protein